MIYGNVEEFKKYSETRGREIPADWTNEKIESALLVSSEWIDAGYDRVFIGTKAKGYLQERSWPRKNATVKEYKYTYPEDKIPDEVCKATYELCFREMVENGCLNKDFKPNKYKSVRVEGAVAVEYSSNLRYESDIQLRVPVVQQLLSNLIDPNKSGSPSVISGKVGRA